jgi:hypothetical protein
MLSNERNSVKPTHYDLALFNLDVDGKSSFSYEGTVKIDLELKEKTDSISLNCKQVTIAEGKLDIEGSSCMLVPS